MWCRWSDEQSACRGGHYLDGCLCPSSGQCAAPVGHLGHWRGSPDPGRCLQLHSCCRSTIIMGQSEEDVKVKERSRSRNQKWKPRLRVHTYPLASLPCRSQFISIKSSHGAWGLWRSTIPLTTWSCQDHQDPWRACPPWLNRLIY